MLHNAIQILLWGFFGAMYLLIFIRVLKNRVAPVKKVKAQVIDKHQVEFFSKTRGNGKRIKYVVVFCAEGKKLSFYVSEFSNGGYRLKEKGTLKYKGDRLIDFS